MIGEYGSISHDGKLTMAGMLSGWNVPEFPFVINCAVAFDIEGLESTMMGWLFFRGPFQSPLEPIQFQLESNLETDDKSGMLFWPLSFVVNNSGMITFELRLENDVVYTRVIPVKLERNL